MSRTSHHRRYHHNRNVRSHYRPKDEWRKREQGKTLATVETFNRPTRTE